MIPIALRGLAFLVLDLALAWWLLRLFELGFGSVGGGADDADEERPDPSAGVRWALFFLLALFGALVLSWVEAGPRRPVEAAFLSAACAVVAAAAAAAAAHAGGIGSSAGTGRTDLLTAGAGGRGSGLGAASAGLSLGLLGCAQGALAGRWVPLSAAIARLGTGFAGGFLGLALPLAFAASLGLTAAVCLHPDFRGVRLRAALLLLLAWAAPTALVEWRLCAAWDFGPESLTQAAGVPAAAAASQVEVAVLRPSAGGAPFRCSRRVQAAEGVDASPESLERLDSYLKTHGHRSLFARQALAAVRLGWLLWWDADQALEAAMRSVPGRCGPDYRKALSLIAAGPLTPARFARLSTLDEAASGASDGFEDVNGSQLVFEAFATAFARFDDERRAQYWLGRVGNLWPINDKKLEVSPLQSLRSGVVWGRVFIDGRPASSVRVGLFLETESEVTRKTTFSLSASAFPDSEGNFVFRYLGSGRYHLELQGTVEQLRGDILGSPGVLSLSEASAAARLEPIRIFPRGRPAGEPAAPADEWLLAEPLGLGGVFPPVGRR
ncbi:MAG: hypothetical protein HY926_03610 [Elusimicrobia bacterium]|nr:hypothetical protein [Elusimicrobiota bacterium]